MGISDQDDESGMIEVLEIAEELPFQTFISYTRLKKVLIISPREFVRLATTTWVGSNTVVWPTKSILFDKYPEKKEYV